MRALLVGCPCCNDAKKFLVDNDEKIVRRKAVCRIENIRPSPANKLLARFKVQSTAVVSGAEPANRKQRPLQLAIFPGDMKGTLDLMMRIRSEINPTRNLQVG